MAKNYLLRNIRTLLIEGFSEVELRDLCAYEDDFRPIRHKVAQNSSKDDLVRLLLEYAEQKSLVEQLLAWARRHNKARYEQHQPYHEVIAKPIKAFEPETIALPAGPFLMGSPPDVAGRGEWLLHPVNLSAYRIGKQPVTNEQYAPFVAQNLEQRPQRGGWRFTNPPVDKLNQPVVGVSWYDALAYCDWLNQETERRYRLPTEAEWEKALRTAQDFQVVSQVWEWTSTLWGEDWQKAQFTYPYQNDERENLKAGPTFYRIYRGGDHHQGEQAEPTIRGYYAPASRDKNLGFRVALDIEV